MKKLIYNPFERIAGVEALGIGLVVMVLISVVAHYSNVVFPDILGAKISSKEYSFLYLIVQNLGNWIIFSSILLLFGIFAGKSHIRAIDVFGTQALARIPYLFFSFLGFADFNDTLNKIAEGLQKDGPQSQVVSELPFVGLLFLAGFALLSIAIVIWIIALMYNAFRISTNIKGEKSAFLFVVAILLSMVVSYFFKVNVVSLFS